jgi:uncharacterized protein (TIGR00290 family)
MRNTILNWSGGKDAALTLHHLLQDNTVKIHSLLTAINKKRRRITMHGVHESLLIAQADSIGFKVEKLELPENISMAKYSEIVSSFAKKHFENKISHYAYGDINLEDLRVFRNQELMKSGIKGMYPLWGRNTLDLAKEFIFLGFKAVVVAVSSDKLDKTFAGRQFDLEFLNELPSSVDPCGENGEFHTFVYDGPIFSKPIPVEIGKISTQTYKPTEGDEDCFCEEEKQKNWDTTFYFCDLKLKNKLT